MKKRKAGVAGVWPEAIWKRTCKNSVCKKGILKRMMDAQSSPNEGRKSEDNGWYLAEEDERKGYAPGEVYDDDVCVPSA